LPVNLNKDTDTHSVFNTYCFSMTTMVTLTRLVVYVMRTLPVLVCLLTVSLKFVDEVFVMFIFCRVSSAL